MEELPQLLEGVPLAAWHTVVSACHSSSSFCLRHTAVYGCSLPQLMDRTKWTGFVVSMMSWSYACYYWRESFTWKASTHEAFHRCRHDSMTHSWYFVPFREFLALWGAVSIWSNREQSWDMTSSCVHSVVFSQMQTVQHNFYSLIQQIFFFS